MLGVSSPLFFAGLVPVEGFPGCPTRGEVGCSLGPPEGWTLLCSVGLFLGGCQPIFGVCCHFGVCCFLEAFQPLFGGAALGFGGVTAVKMNVRRM